MKCLTGDIILYTTVPTGPFYKRTGDILELLFKRSAYAAQYKHVAIAVGTQTMVHALWPRVQRCAINWTDPGIEVWRVNNATPSERHAAAVEATIRIGNKYNFKNRLVGLFPSHHAEICSVLVEDSWGGSCVLAPKPANNVVSPDALAAGGILTKVYG